MSIETGQVKVLSQALLKLKAVVDEIHPMLSPARLLHNRLESEFSQANERNKNLQDENMKIEANIAKSVETAKSIVTQGETEKQRLRLAAGELYAKAYNKFQELEEFLSDAEKKAAKRHLRELEEVAK